MTVQRNIFRTYLAIFLMGAICENSGAIVGAGDSPELGKDWKQATAEAEWPERYGHASVVHDSKIWVIGGFWHLGLGNNHYLNDVWYSDDGATWFEATPAAQWVAQWRGQ